jgi:hypothetical protein
VLNHIPLRRADISVVESNEGLYTEADGSLNDFENQLTNQKEIKSFVEKVFSKTKGRLSR